MPPGVLQNPAKVALALLLGAIAGYLLNRLNFPLAWMIGAMLAVTLAAIVRLPVAAPAALRPSMKAVVGAMMGAGIGSDIFDRIGTWVVPLSALLAANLLGAIIAFTLLRRVAPAGQAHRLSGGGSRRHGRDDFARR